MIKKKYVVINQKLLILHDWNCDNAYHVQQSALSNTRKYKIRTNKESIIGISSFFHQCIDVETYYNH